MRIPELVRPPICPALTEETEGEERSYLLANGERFVLAEPGDQRSSEEISGSLCRRLKKKAALLEDFGKDGFKNLCCSALQFQFGLDDLDAEYWARRIEAEDPITEKIFPHWMFVSILAAAKFGNLYDFPPPFFIEAEPINEEFKAKTPPILTGTAVPILGNFGSCLRPFFKDHLATLLRKREGLTAPGKYSFPGGKTKDVLELTAWREFREETRRPSFLSLLGLAPGLYTLVRRVEFLAVVDQTLMVDHEQRRFKNYVFAFWLAFPYEGGGGFVAPMKEIYKEIKNEGSDGQGVWQTVLLNPGGEIEDAAIRNNLSPIGEIVAKILQEHPFVAKDPQANF